MKTIMLNPPVELSLSSFNEAAALLKDAEFFLLCIHPSVKDMADVIVMDYKARGQEVDILVCEGDREQEWFVHGVRPGIPPIIGTVFSRIK